MHVTHDLATRIEIAQHGRVARLNRLVNSNRAAGEIVTPPSITLPWKIRITGDVLTMKIKKVGSCFIDRKYEKRETFLQKRLRK